MPAVQRDRVIIEQILRYCEHINTAHLDFDSSKARFLESTTYQNAVSMCILQIGELAGRLSDDFRAVHNEIPWQRIKGMRNFVAHAYGLIDFDVVWYVSTISINELQQFCIHFLTSV